MRWNEAMGEHGGQALRLLVGDAQPLVTAGLAALLERRGHVVTGRAGTGAEAAAAIAEGGVDIAILDIDLVDPSPLTLLGARRSVSIVILAPDADHPALIKVIEAGANGLVLKSQGAASLDHCLIGVAAGRQWYDRGTVAHAFGRREAMGAATSLTPRERDVARLVATGQRNRNIAGALGISEGTVKMHLHNVYAKLGLESRTQLAMDERLRLLV